MPKRTTQILSVFARLVLPAVIAAGILFDPAIIRPAVPAASPFFAACAAVAARAVTLAMLAGLPVLLICLWRRRWVCRWVCPAGLLGAACATLRPGARRPRRFPRIGRWLALLTAGGAIIGVPLFIWMDPVMLLAGRGWFVFPGAVAVLGFLAPGLWCGRLCPLGATQDLLATPGKLIRDRGNTGTEGFAAARRSFLCVALGAAAGFALRRLMPGAARRLRPPGAVPGERFPALCVRCGNCVRACPTGIIRQDTDPPGTTGLGLPLVRFERGETEAWCRQDCNRCGAACPSGAIEPLGVAEKNRRPIGRAVVDVPACLLTDDLKCGVCLVNPPCTAIGEVFDKDTYTWRIVIDEQACNGCGWCVTICPAAAIAVHPVARG